MKRVLLLALLPGLSLAAATQPDASAPDEASAAVSTAAATNAAPSTSRKADHFISDDVYTFLRGGAGKQFRILGSVKAGEAVVLLGTSPDGKYSQIIDPKGRTAWIESDFVQKDPSFRQRVSDLQQKADGLQHTMDNLDTEQARRIKAQDAELDKLRKDNSAQAAELQQLKAKLDKVQDENQTLSNSLDTREDDARYRWWREGSYIAVGGLILGLILPWLPRPRRKRRDRWMN